MRFLLNRSASRILWVQGAIVVLLFALATMEMQFEPSRGIQESGTPWGVDLSLDPRYGERVLLLVVNIIGSSMVGLLTLGMIRQRQTAGVEGIVLSGTLSLLAMIKAWLWSPFWINGVPAALAMTHRPDMDPKALLPAIWFPDFMPWQLLIFTLICLFYPAMLVVIGVMVRAVWNRHRWQMAFLTPIPLLIAIWLLWGTSGLGVWLGD